MKNGYKNLSKDELYLISRAEFEKQKLITTPRVIDIDVLKSQLDLKTEEDPKTKYKISD